jgi:KaiC/GvpD/RAD55 family RecA-like ATPase
MSVQTQVSLIPWLTILPLRPADLATAAPGIVPWLWHGYLAQGKVTALVSQSKSGKTTLVAHLLARMAQGGQLAG